MLQRVSIAVLAWLVVGCTDAEPETAVAEQGLTATCSCEAPTPAPWVPGRATTEMLFPTSVDHLETFVTPADEAGFYAWGISNGEVLWLYRVDDAYTSDFLASLGKAWMLTGINPGKSHGIQGALKGPPPPPPVPTGEPLFSPAYVQRVLVSAQQHQDATEIEIDKLGGL